MKTTKFILLACVTLMAQLALAQFCSTSGNVVIFANYDGGVLNINVDQNIPNLKIGVCTYEATTINISGPFAGNVTAVQYAGFDSSNEHCDQVISNTTINGVSSSITEILFAPPSTFSDPDGYGSMICAYSCDTDWQGGCNTAEQIVEYFLNEFGGDLLLYKTQYECWPSESISISEGGSCCPGIELTAPLADFEMSDSNICPGDCIQLTDLSTNSPTSWSWSFVGASVATSSLQNPINICFNSPGVYPVTLNASNIYGNTIDIQYITVEECPIPGCTYEQAINFNPAATVDDHSCTFICNGGCPGDFNGDFIISVADLIEFIGVYGSICPN